MVVEKRFGCLDAFNSLGVNQPLLFLAQSKLKKNMTMDEIMFTKIDRITKKKTAAQEIPIDFTTQVIVCGSLSNKFWAGVNEGKLEYNEEERFPAFLFSKKGTIDIQTDITLNSSIDYKESHKRKKERKIDFKHQDKFEERTHYSSISSSQYKITTANFDFQYNTWIVLTAKDKHEEDSIIQELSTLIKNSRFKLCLFTLPDVIDGNKLTLNHSSNLKVSHTSLCSIQSHEDLIKEGKKFEEKLLEDVEGYLKILKSELAETLKLEALQEIENEIHQEADQYFEKKNKCTIM